MIFNNPSKVCFSNKKYPITIQTSPTQIVFNAFLKIISAQNRIPINFCSDLECNKTLKAKPPHTRNSNL